MEVIYRHCAGLDVHKNSIMANARQIDDHGKVHAETRKFGTMTRELLALSDWLASQGVTHVAMESTGVFWKPVFNILEGRFEMLLVNPQHIKQVPGRKTDVKDCEWIGQLLQHGLLRASFVPPRPQRDLRDLTRHRATGVRADAGCQPGSQDAGRRQRQARLGGRRYPGQVGQRHDPGDHRRRRRPAEDGRVGPRRGCA